MNEQELLRSFRKNPDGSWSCVKPVSIEGPGGSVGLGPGASFTRGAAFMGLNLAAMLDEAEARRGGAGLG